MELLTEQEYDRITFPDAYYSILKTWHFSHSQKHRLRQLVKRWQATVQRKDMMSYLEDCPDAKSVVKKLSIKLDGYKMDWGEG